MENMKETTKKIRKVKTPEEKLAEIKAKQLKLIAEEDILKKKIKEQKKILEKEKMEAFYLEFMKSFPAIKDLDKEDIKLLAELMIEEQGQTVINKVLTSK